MNPFSCNRSKIIICHNFPSTGFVAQHALYSETVPSSQQYPIGDLCGRVLIQYTRTLKRSRFRRPLSVLLRPQRYSFWTSSPTEPNSADFSLSNQSILVPPRRSCAPGEAIPFRVVTGGIALKLTAKPSILSAIVGFSISRFFNPNLDTDPVPVLGTGKVQV